MKFVHTFINHAVTNPYINLINNRFSKKEHVFYIIRGLPQDVSQSTVSENVFLITTYTNILNGFRLWWDLLSSDKVLIHGLFTPYLMFLLFSQPWILKKCNWIIWGADLYIYLTPRATLFSKFVEFMRKKIIMNFNEITTPVSGDFRLAQDWYKVRGERKIATYPFVLDTKQVDKVIGATNRIDLNSEDLKILIGNSSSLSNKHFEILDSLEKFNIENIKVYAILGYGDKSYADEVIDYGHNKLGDKFRELTEYYSYNDFVKFLNSIDIVIFNHERQQGMGVLLLAIYIGKKVYINDKSPLWSYLTDDLNLKIFRFCEIANESFNDFKTIDDSVLSVNRNIIGDLMNKDKIIQQWSKIFC